MAKAIMNAKATVQTLALTPNRWVTRSMVLSNQASTLFAGGPLVFPVGGGPLVFPVAAVTGFSRKVFSFTRVLSVISREVTTVPWINSRSNNAAMRVGGGGVAAGVAGAGELAISVNMSMNSRLRTAVASFHRLKIAANQG